MSISFRLTEKEEKLVIEYAKANNITVSTLLRESVLARIENEIDLDLYDEAITEHRKKDISISFNEMLDELEIDS